VIVKADKATEIQESLIQAGVKTWQLGIIESNDCSLQGYIQGAKGVDGGAVRLLGKYKN
jgi:phosphoribosylformylglycinamidine cyclo-ligase